MVLARERGGIFLIAFFPIGKKYVNMRGTSPEQFLNIYDESLRTIFGKTSVKYRGLNLFMQTKSARNASTLMYSWTQVFLFIWNERKTKIKKNPTCI